MNRKEIEQKLTAKKFGITKRGKDWLNKYLHKVDIVATLKLQELVSELQDVGEALKRM